MKMFSLNDIDLFVQQNVAYQNRGAPNWTTEEEALNAIAAAVAAERRRVWDVLDVLFNKHKENGEPSLAFAIDEAVCTLFPDGEPQPTNTTGPSPIELLKDLADLQNGPPLEQHRKEWEETMDKVYKCLSEHGL